jgi:hypothetical protein
MFTNWKTTMAGVLGGLCILFGPRLQGAGGPPINVNNVATAAVVMTLGALAKDSDKSNAPNPLPTAQKINSPN